MEAIIFLGLLSAVWLFTSGAGIIRFIKELFKLDNEAKITNVKKHVLREFLNCAMCIGFWTGLLFYSVTGYDHFFLLACLTAIAAEIFSRLMNLILNEWLNKF